MLVDTQSQMGTDEKGNKTMQTLGYNMGAILQKYLQHYVKNR